jgi:Protein of unknown function (DUF1345)
MSNGEVQTASSETPPSTVSAPASASASATGADAPEVVAAIKSLHARIDELHRVVVQRLEADGELAEDWVHSRAGVLVRRPQLPAWRRETSGEVRWPVTICVAAAIALQNAVPDRLVLVRPVWVLPVVQALLLLVLVAANPHRINRQSKALRMVSLVLVALVSLANMWSVALLCQQITDGSMHGSAKQLLITGGAVWLTNVVVFALWYWEFDRGGPAARALNTRRYPDFQFPQMISPREMIPPDWEPAFVDYFYLAFTNASAFSPTDVMPLSRWAKLAMTVQASISIITVALVVSRAVNILPLSAGGDHIYMAGFSRVTCMSCCCLRHWLEATRSLTG